MVEIKQSSRVVINRKAFDELELAMADGLFALAVKVVETARPPDAPPYGVGLVQQGGAVAWVGNKKVDGSTINGKQIKKPSGLKLDPNGVTAIAGFGFPARFVELGTVRTHAEPFLTPALAEVLPGANVVVSEAVKRRLRGEREVGGVGDIIAAARARKAARLAGNP